MQSQPQEGADAPPVHGIVHPAYKYVPLSEDNSNIRIVLISAGEFEHDIEVTILNVPFAVQLKRSLPYEALSYTWGSAEDPSTIAVKINSKMYSLGVTRNCEEAIRYLRHRTKPRVVWIDAICINQTDLDERARQVAIMKDIYSRARRVIVWIGPSSDDSDLALRWIRTVCQEVSYDMIRGELHSLARDTRRVDLHDIIATDSELEAFTMIIERSYFERLWVWQEVRMGGQNVKLNCGSEEVDFCSLMTAVGYCLRKLVKGDIGVRRLTPRGNFIRLLPLAGEFNNLDTMNTMRMCRCADQRDRVYTAQAFGNGLESVQVAVDYKRPIQEVYTESALRHMLFDKSLSILLYVGDDLPHEDVEPIAGLPSWVPDWSRRNTAERLTLSHASSNSRASVVRLSPDEKRLTVRGVRVGKVAKAVQIGLDLLTHKNTNVFYAVIGEALQAIVPKEIKIQALIPPGADARIWPQGTDRSKFLELVRLLTQGSYAERYLPHSTRPSFEKVEKLVIGALLNLGPDILSQEQSYTLKSFYDCRGRSLFLTEDGRLGLGPRDIEAGDDLVVVLGASALIVLRPRVAVLPDNGIDKNVSRIVGNAACTGLMDGEAILGPLPQQYETVYVLDESSGVESPAIREKHTGVVMYEDPRLPSLPPEWKDVTADSVGVPLCWKNEKTQEWLPFNRDPRLDADALRSRGVKVEEFCLE